MKWKLSWKNGAFRPEDVQSSPCEGFPEDATHVVKDIDILRNSRKLPGNNGSEFSL